MSQRLINEISELCDTSDKYFELLYAVARKFPNETRHETALRYIKQAEDSANELDKIGKASE